jgi:SSS family solute:Na+ symporter
LSFVSANLGSLELLGWAGASYQYGILAAHWYWIGAIPAMIFLGIVMMPFYYICKTHSVPGYLTLRYDGRAGALSAGTFAVMTILMSGVNMFAMAKIMSVLLGWNIHLSIWVSSITVGVYVVAGGLFSAIFNEVVQFFLIWFGALLIPILGLIECGGWSGMVAKIEKNFQGDYTHAWRSLGHFQDNPMGMHWTGIVFGLGSVLAMGYWTTDFLVVQRVLAAKDLRSAKMAPILGSFFKMAVPLIVILPGLIGLAVLPEKLVPETANMLAGQHSYNDVLPLIMIRYFGPGLLGLGVTALIAGFMAGMAGNTSAFGTVWTYDLYRPFINKNASDAHYVSMGRWCTIVGLIASIGTAYMVMGFASIMDYVQALFGFFIAPLFGTVLIAMLWKRATSAGGFLGLLAGVGSSITMFFAMHPPSADALHKIGVNVSDAQVDQFRESMVQLIALSKHAKGLAQDMYQALWAGVICVTATVLISLMTQPKPDSELTNLVMGTTVIPKEENVGWLGKPAVWACVSIACLIVLQIIFW